MGLLRFPQRPAPCHLFAACLGLLPHSHLLACRLLLNATQDPSTDCLPACLPVSTPCLPALRRTLCSLILKAMQDPEYAPYLDDAIAREKKRHDGVRGARCAVAGGSAARGGPTGPAQERQ